MSFTRKLRPTHLLRLWLTSEALLDSYLSGKNFMTFHVCILYLIDEKIFSINY